MVDDIDRAVVRDEPYLTPAQRSTIHFGMDFAWDGDFSSSIVFRRRRLTAKIKDTTIHIRNSMVLPELHVDPEQLARIRARVAKAVDEMLKNAVTRGRW